MRNRLAYTTASGNPNHADAVARIHAARVRVAPPQGPACRTVTPEPHLAGEFPMSCHACHMVADS